MTSVGSVESMYEAHDEASVTWLTLSLRYGAYGSSELEKRIAIKGAITEGDRVALLIDGFSTMKDGQEYNNHYHNLFSFRDGKVCKMIEYCDLVLADAVLGPYLPPHKEA